MADSFVLEIPEKVGTRRRHGSASRRPRPATGPPARASSRPTATCWRPTCWVDRFPST